MKTRGDARMTQGDGFESLKREEMGVEVVDVYLWVGGDLKTPEGEKADVLE